MISTNPEVRELQAQDLDQVSGGIGPFGAFFVAFLVTDITLAGDEGVIFGAVRMAKEQQQKKQKT